MKQIIVFVLIAFIAINAKRLRFLDEVENVADQKDFPNSTISWME